MSVWLERTTSYWQSGGLLLLFIALVCFAIWGLFLRSREMISRTIAESQDIRDEIHNGTFGKTPTTLIAGLRSMKGTAAAAISEAMHDITNGSVPREAFTAREAEYMDLLQRDLLALTALTAIAPLLGLLGTVMGMIETFDAVATVSGNTGSRVAAGISQALITTQFGLVVAMPGVFGIARLRRMLRNARSVMGDCRAHALQIFENNSERGSL